MNVPSKLAELSLFSSIYSKAVANTVGESAFGQDSFNAVLALMWKGCFMCCCLNADL